MHSREIALTTFRRHQSRCTSQSQQFGRKTLTLQFCQQPVQTRTMAANHNQICRLKSLSLQLNSHRLAGHQQLCVTRNRDETIRAAECGDRTGSFAHRKRPQPVVCRDQRHQQIFRASHFGIHLHGQLRSDSLRRRRTPTRQPPQYGRYKFVKCEDCRCRKPRQHNHRNSIFHSDTQWLAGLERHAMHNNPRPLQLTNNPVTQIPFAFAGSTRQQHHVMFSQRAGHRGLQTGTVVPDDPTKPRQPPGFQYCVRKNSRVRIVNSGRTRRFSGSNDLIPRGKNRHRRPAKHLDLSFANGRQHPGFPTGQQSSRAQHHFTNGDVSSRKGNSGSRGHTPANKDPAGFLVRRLHHHHSVCAARHHPSGRNHHRLTGQNFQFRHTSGFNPFRKQLQGTRLQFCGTAGVFTANGVAIEI